LQHYRLHWSPHSLEWLSKKFEEGRSRSNFFFPVFATQPDGLACVAVLSVGVIYGTDIFFALIGRKALAHSSEAAIADVIGHVHEVADARMPIFGVLGLLASLAFLVLVGLGTRKSPRPDRIDRPGPLPGPLHNVLEAH
jgi:hypothetical protein